MTRQPGRSLTPYAYQANAPGGKYIGRFASAEEALKGLTADYPGIVVSDIRMPGMDGLALMQQARNCSPETVRVMISGQVDEAGFVVNRQQRAWSTHRAETGSLAINLVITST